MNQQVQPGAAPARKTSTGVKWAIGCGIGCLVMLLIVMGGCAIFVHSLPRLAEHLEQKIMEAAGNFEAQGYAAVVGQDVVVTEPVTNRTVYTVQSLKVMADCDSDIAILCSGTAEICGRVGGDVFFNGQTLTVQRGAAIEGNVTVSAQNVTVYGEIHGQILGVYQSLEDYRTTNSGEDGARE